VQVASLPNVWTVSIPQRVLAGVSVRFLGSAMYGTKTYLESSWRATSGEADARAAKAREATTVNCILQRSLVVLLYRYERNFLLLLVLRMMVDFSGEEKLAVLIGTDEWH
jgi:hypothetical protein